MSMIETIMNIDRKLRRIYEELGMDYDDPVTQVMVPKSEVPSTPVKRTRRMEVRPNTWGPEHHKQLIDLLLKGVSRGEIARIMERTRSSIGSQIYR